MLPCDYVMVGFSILLELRQKKTGHRSRRCRQMVADRANMAKMSKKAGIPPKKDQPDVLVLRATVY